MLIKCHYAANKLTPNAIQMRFSCFYQKKITKRAQGINAQNILVQIQVTAKLVGNALKLVLYTP